MRNTQTRRHLFRRRGVTLVEVVVAASVSALVTAGVVGLMYISGRAVHDLYETTRSRSQRAVALNQIRFRLADAQQGSCTVLDSGRTIRFHDPNLGTGVTSELQFNQNDRSLYYTANISNRNATEMVAQGPIDIRFTLGSTQLDKPNYTTLQGQDGVVVTYVQTSEELAYARVDTHDGETIVHLRNMVH